MVVVAHTEASSDQVADHRPGPQAGHEPSRLGTGLDRGHEFLALCFAQPGWTAWPLPRSEPVGALGLEPLKPSVDGSPCDVELGTQRDHRLLLDVTQHRLRAAPSSEIAALLRLDLQSDKLHQLLPRDAAGADGLSLLRMGHDLLLIAGDRPTMILDSSSVNFLDLFRGDPV